ncbi:MAG: iron-sulfur cluster assembly protein [Verrucomicrobiae bacterium]|nr:iron-sulfur cluster assembly protein [Verrucomicrobiae bacterium]
MSEITIETVYSVLKNCYDPEIPVNLVDLGLIYDVVIEGTGVRVKMTLTTPGCHMGPSIANDVQTKLLAVDGIDEASVDIVFDPPWNQSMISADGRKKLGMV